MPKKLTEADQLEMIRRNENRYKRAEKMLQIERKRREALERELQSRSDFQELVEATSGPINRRMIETVDPPRKNGDAEAIFCVTDWHAEENVDPAMVNGLNKFNLTVAKKRIENTFRKFVKVYHFSCGIQNIENAVLWLGGDLINGYIHEELEESNFLGNAQAIMYITEQVAGGIDYILKHTDLKHVRVVCNYGNHGRGTKQKRVSTGWRSSWEWLAYNQLAREYRNESRLSWHIAQGYHSYVPIFNWTIRTHHGDGIKYNGGVGGITIPVNKAIAQWNKSKRADFDIFGHYHTYLHNWNFLSTGCLVGYNAYALSIKADYQPPTQAYVVVDKDRGVVMCLPIFCDKA